MNIAMRMICLATFSSLVLFALLLFPIDVRSADRDVMTNTIGMRLIEIPAGEFMMGAEDDEETLLDFFPYCNPEALEGQWPQHRIRLTKAFDMGQYEVTLREFQKFCNDAGYKVEAERDGQKSWGYQDGKAIRSNRFRPSEPIGWKAELDHPVIFITWNDAVAFCEWLSKAEGQTYRLPTEAEWEYACRAGAKTRFPFGPSIDDMNLYANAADVELRKFFPVDQGDSHSNLKFLHLSDGYAWVAPVGKYRPNAFGLFDMNGNVWEWCSDWFDENYYKRSPPEDPLGPSTGTLRVIRGGSFENAPVDMRCSHHFRVRPSFRHCSIGFRVVRVH